MKKTAKLLLAVFVILSVAVSFYAGQSMARWEFEESRQQRCGRLILFAIDKAENHDLTESGVAEALISNLYGAHEFCDDPELSAQLNDLWNSLIYRREEFTGKEAALAAQLRDILTKLQMAE